MAIPNNLIVVIQNEPRDGDIVYVEKDEEAFRNRVREVICEEWEDDQIELGQRYYDDCAMVTIIGQEMQFPYPINNVCPDCFQRQDSGFQNHNVGESMVINFVEKADCENCKEE
jgi:hypothetical protein